MLLFCFNPYGMLPGTHVVPCGEHPEQPKTKKIDSSCSFFLHYFGQSCCVDTLLLLALFKIFDCRKNVLEDYKLNKRHDQSQIKNVASKHRKNGVNFRFIGVFARGGFRYKRHVTHIGYVAQWKPASSVFKEIWLS